jgi:hypothetical protein
VEHPRFWSFNADLLLRRSGVSTAMVPGGFHPFAEATAVQAPQATIGRPIGAKTIVPTGS